jgi:hypothetical protein
LTWINGHKTYLVALGAVLAGIGQFLTGDIDIMGLANYMLAGAGAAAIRHALPTK